MTKDEPREYFWRGTKAAERLRIRIGWGQMDLKDRIQRRNVLTVGDRDFLDESRFNQILRTGDSILLTSTDISELHLTKYVDEGTLNLQDGDPIKTKKSRGNDMEGITMEFRMEVEIKCAYCQQWYSRSLKAGAQYTHHNRYSLAYIIPEPQIYNDDSTELNVIEIEEIPLMCSVCFRKRAPIVLEAKRRALKREREEQIAKIEYDLKKISEEREAKSKNLEKRQKELEIQINELRNLE